MAGAVVSARKALVRVTAVGGGHGLARTLEAVLHLGIEPTAVVTVADDGGSSGRLRQAHGILALGDMRMALQTLARHQTQDGKGQELAALFGHRFEEGDIAGHALGNLVLLALIQNNGGDVAAAVHLAAAMLGCRGRVVPCTVDEVTLVAQVDQDKVQGQVAIQNTSGRHRSVWLEPRTPRACADAVQAIVDADVVLMGPGSLYTSIIPNLLVPGIEAAIGTSHAPLVYVANLTCQPGETSGMSLHDHVDALLAYIPSNRTIAVIAHDGPEVTGSGQSLQPVVDLPGVSRVHRADLAARRADGTPVAAHDAKRLARVLDTLLG